jgi:hypothetical protein
LGHRLVVEIALVVGDMGSPMPRSTKGRTRDPRAAAGERFAMKSIAPVMTAMTAIAMGIMARLDFKESRPTTDLWKKGIRKKVPSSRIGGPR